MNNANNRLKSNCNSAAFNCNRLAGASKVNIPPVGCNPRLCQNLNQNSQVFAGNTSSFSFIRFWPIFQLQASKKIAQNLIFAEPIVVLARFAEKSGYLMLADREPRQSHDFLDVISLQIQGYP